MLHRILFCNVWFSSLYTVLMLIEASPDGDCIYNCMSATNGLHASCKNCAIYFHCYQGSGKLKTCPSGQEWDSDQNACISGKSTTCDLNGDSREITVGIDTEEDSTTKSSTTKTTTESTFIPNAVHKTHANMPINDTLLDGNENKDCSTPELGIDCSYLIALSALGGFLPIVPLFLCWNYCRQKKMVTTFTQTRIGSDNRYIDSIYDDISLVTSDNYVRYQPMPYAVSSSNRPYQPILPSQPTDMSYTVSNNPPYQSIQPNHPSGTSIQDDNITGESNIYLELVGYNYLQTQEMNVRSEIDKGLAPMVVQLCHKYRNDPEEYQSVLEKLHKIFDESSKGKSPLEMVIDDLYAGSKYSGYLVPLNERKSQHE